MLANWGPTARKRGMCAGESLLPAPLQRVPRPDVAPPGYLHVTDLVNSGDTVATSEKIVFIAFAIEDQRQRDFLKGQSLSPRAPYSFVDMSVKEPYQTEWKKKVRTRILRSHGVIVLVSENSLTSAGQKWEIQCAKEEDRPIRGIWAYTDDRTNLAGVNTVVWSDANISNFIDSL